MNPQTQEDALTTLLDGREIEVTHCDGSTERVKVRKIPIRRLSEFAGAWGRPEKEAPFYADRSPHWTESLTDDSFAELMDVGRELNFASFKRWFRWQVQSLEAVNVPMPTLVLPKP